MAKYAVHTTVPVSRSKEEIEKILCRYGAEGFGYYTKNSRAVVVFEILGRPFRIELPLPSTTEFLASPTGKERKTSVAEAEHEKACRQRWRVLCLMLKAKLEAVDIGVTSIDAEFMSHMVLANGQTLGEKMLPHLKEIAASGNVHKFLPGPEE